MDITATFTVTPKECRRAARRFPLVRFLTVLGVLAMLAAALLSVLDGRLQPRYFAPGLVLLLVSEFGIVRLTARANARLTAEPWTVRLTDEGYEMQTAAGRTTAAWGLHRRMTSSGGFWYLEHANRTVTFLPQRILDGPRRAEAEAFFADRLPPRPWYRPW
ncbi:hypothetical protein [Kitasatospora sp. NPDC051914]|uniref:hypothetical protein n=1 Tax=Kitasatospora sp. NPDC051914 TaxID=3154945 RepID=UPI00343C7537